MGSEGADSSRDAAQPPSHDDDVDLGSTGSLLDRLRESNADRSPDGDRAALEDAESEFYRRFFGEVLALAESATRGRGRGGAEDVAISAIRTTIQRIGDGRLPECRDSDDLRRLFRKLTRNKSVRDFRRATTQKRSPHKTMKQLVVEHYEVLPERLRDVARLRFVIGLKDYGEIAKQTGLPPDEVSARCDEARAQLTPLQPLNVYSSTDKAAARESTPNPADEAVIVREILGMLDPTQRDIAVLLIAGFSKRQVAAKLSMGYGMVERNVDAIKRLLVKTFSLENPQ